MPVVAGQTIPNRDRSIGQMRCDFSNPGNKNEDTHV
jgi:hypothetical protein